MSRADREEQILTSARELFTERGYPNVSMDAIAERTGITKPLIYSYFGSKENLYVVCIQRFLAPLEAAVVATIDEQLPPEQRMWDGARVFFEWVGAHLDGWRRFFVEAPAHGERAAAAVDEIRARAVDQLVAMVWQAMQDSGLSESLKPEASYQVHIFMGGFESLARWWVSHPDEATAEILAARLLNQTWMGFGALLEGRFWVPPEHRR